MGGSFFRLSFFLKNSLRLISSGFYPALRTPSFRHPKDTNINLECQQKKNKSFSCLIRGLFVYLGMEKNIKTILQIKPGKDTGFAYQAIGAGYVVTLSNNIEIDSDDEDLLERYADVRDGRKSLPQLNDLLVGKIWDDSY